MIHITAFCDSCDKSNILPSKSIRLGLQQAIYGGWNLVEGEGYFTSFLFCPTCSETLGILVKCHGEAHSNGFIDHCSVCVPLWGVVRANPMPTREQILITLREKFPEKFHHLRTDNEIRKENGEPIL